MRAAWLLVCLLLLPASAWALEPGEALEDPVLEERARALSEQVRCPVCQNEAISSSSAPVARDLRRLIRERLVAGDSDAAVLAYLHARYGDFVLMQPRLTPGTVLLWAAPLLLLAVGGLIAWRRLRRSPVEAAAEGLSTVERDRLKEFGREGL